MDDFGNQFFFEFSEISKRLRGMAMMARGIVPHLVLSQKVVDKITVAAKKFIEDETGEAMIGFQIPADPTDEHGLPTIYVVDTISPDETAIRQMHTFQQGDDMQDEIIWWLQENWHLSRRLGIDTNGKPLDEKWHVPLRYVGDWHKQPGFMIAPSYGDLRSALDWLDDHSYQESGSYIAEMDYLLVPIVTLGHPSTTVIEGSRMNYMLIPQEDGTNLRVDWWYIHRHVRMFQPLFPIVVPESELPPLARYPWHLVDDERAETEIVTLEDNGYIPKMILWEGNNDLPMEICFLVLRQGISEVFLVSTKWNYPEVAPIVRIAPYKGMGQFDTFHAMFADAWDNSEVVSMPDFKWTPDKLIIDYIHAVEKHLGYAPAPPPPEVVEMEVEPAIYEDEYEGETSLKTLLTDEQIVDESPEMNEQVIAKKHVTVESLEAEAKQSVEIESETVDEVVELESVDVDEAIAIDELEIDVVVEPELNKADEKEET